MSTAKVPVLVAEGNLSGYLQEIRKFPMLEQDEEFMLAKAWRERGDAESAHRLVTSHLRLVAKIAMGYRGYGLPLSELISEGNVGMMQAVKRFDPDRGFRLATYAMWWIRAAIQEYILHSWSLVKMGTTASQKKLFFNLRKLKGQLKAMEEGDLHPENVSKIAETLGVPEQDVVSMNRRLAAPDHSLNAPLRIDGDGEWQDWLVDENVGRDAPDLMPVTDIMAASGLAEYTPNTIAEFWLKYLLKWEPAGGWKGTKLHGTLSAFISTPWDSDTNGSFWNPDFPIPLEDIVENSWPNYWNERVRGLVKLIFATPEFMQR